MPGAAKFGPKLELKQLGKEHLEDEKLEDELMNTRHDEAGNGTLGRELENIPDHVESNDGVTIPSESDSSAGLDLGLLTRTQDTQLFPKGTTDNQVLKAITGPMRNTAADGGAKFNYTFKEVSESKENLYKTLQNQRIAMEAQATLSGKQPEVFTRVHWVEDFNDIRAGDVTKIHEDIADGLLDAIARKDPNAFKDFYETLEEKLVFDSEVNFNGNAHKFELKSSTQLKQVPFERRMLNRTKRLIIARNALRYAEKKALVAYGKEVAPGIKMKQGGEIVKWFYG